MSTEDQGTQTILYKYSTPLIGEDLAKIIGSLTFKGVVQKPSITYLVPGNYAVIGAMEILIGAQYNSAALVKILTATSHNLLLTYPQRYICFEYSWQDSADWYGEFKAYTEEEIADPTTLRWRVVLAEVDWFDNAGSWELTGTPTFIGVESRTLQDRFAEKFLTFRVSHGVVNSTAVRCYFDFQDTTRYTPQITVWDEAVYGNTADQNVYQVPVTQNYVDVTAPSFPVGAPSEVWCALYIGADGVPGFYWDSYSDYADKPRLRDSSKLWIAYVKFTRASFPHIPLLSSIENLDFPPLIDFSLTRQGTYTSFLAANAGTLASPDDYLGKIGKAIRDNSLAVTTAPTSGTQIVPYSVLQGLGLTSSPKLVSSPDDWDDYTDSVGFFVASDTITNEPPGRVGDALFVLVLPLSSATGIQIAWSSGDSDGNAQMWTRVWNSSTLRDWETYFPLPSNLATQSQITGTEGTISRFKSGGIGLEDGSSSVRWVDAILENETSVPSSLDIKVGLNNYTVAALNTSTKTLSLYRYGDFSSIYGWILAGTAFSISTLGASPKLAPLADALGTYKVVCIDSTTHTLQTYATSTGIWVSRGSGLEVASGSVYGDMISLSPDNIILSRGNVVKQYSFSEDDVWSEVRTVCILEAGLAGCHLARLSSTKIIVQKYSDSTFQIYSFNGSSWVAEGPEYFISSGYVIYAALDERSLFIRSSTSSFRIYTLQSSSWVREFSKVNCIVGDYKIALLPGTNSFVSGVTGSWLKYNLIRTVGSTFANY